MRKLFLLIIILFVGCGLFAQVSTQRVVNVRITSAASVGVAPADTFNVVATVKTDQLGQGYNGSQIDTLDILVDQLGRQFEVYSITTQAPGSITFRVFQLQSANIAPFGNGVVMAPTANNLRLLVPANDNGITSALYARIINHNANRIDTLINAQTDDQTAAEVNITDSGGYYTGTEVETALQEVGASLGAITDTDDQTLSKPTTDSIAIEDGNTIVDRSLMQSLPLASVGINGANSNGLFLSGLSQLNIGASDGAGNTTTTIFGQGSWQGALATSGGTNSGLLWNSTGFNWYHSDGALGQVNLHGIASDGDGAGLYAEDTDTRYAMLGRVAEISANSADTMSFRVGFDRTGGSLPYDALTVQLWDSTANNINFYGEYNFPNSTPPGDSSIMYFSAVGVPGWLEPSDLGGAGSGTTEAADGVTILGDGGSGTEFRVDTALIATTQAVIDSIAANGGGLTDGDKGDITVSGSGTVLDIDAGVVGPTEIASTAVTPGSYTYSSLTVDADGRLTAASSGAAPGDVTGPGSSTDNAIARFDGTGGKTLQNSAVTISDAGAVTLNGGNIALNGEYLSGDGDDEGVFVNNSGVTILGGNSFTNIPGNEKLVLTGSGGTFLGRTTLSIENTNTTAGSLITFTNNTGRYAGIQYTGETYSIGEKMFINTSGDYPIEFVTNGSSGASGGTSTITFRPGGVSDTPSMIAKSSKVSIATTSDPDADLDIFGTARVRDGEIGLSATGTTKIKTGSGSPESVVSASPGSTYHDTTNGDLYVKETGTGSTGWVQIDPTGSDDMGNMTATGTLEMGFYDIADVNDIFVDGGFFSTDLNRGSGSPTFSWEDDDDTGMYRDDANELNFSTGGSERMVIDASGNVGVNEATPDEKLTVNGNIKTTQDVFVGANIEFTTGPVILAGSGAPESVVTAPPGSLYLNSGGGAGATLYVKESGTGNTGWVAK